MNDLTILYYTANTLNDSTAEKVRDNLLKVTEKKYPIISVSQKPINFGHNICVGEIGRSKYNCYKQILIGVREVKTKYVACAEDDTLYSVDHFLYRPPKGFFCYETNMWLAQENFYWRMEEIDDRTGMWGCIAETENLVKNLTKRYSLYPTDPLPKKDKAKSKYNFLIWGEPGMHDNLFGMENKRKLFESREPTVTFIYRASMGGRHFLGRHKVSKPENMTYNLKNFGGAGKLWKSYWLQ